MRDPFIPGHAGRSSFSGAESGGSVYGRPDGNTKARSSVRTTGP
ncbi:hypothetical protein KPATCC21470_6273 [Kitasatospora purpeofusca]